MIAMYSINFGGRQIAAPGDDALIPSSLYSGGALIHGHGKKQRWKRLHQIIPRHHSNTPISMLTSEGNSDFVQENEGCQSCFRKKTCHDESN